MSAIAMFRQLGNALQFRATLHAHLKPVDAGRITWPHLFADSRKNTSVPKGFEDGHPRADSLTIVGNCSFRPLGIGIAEARTKIHQPIGDRTSSRIFA